jgi:2-polyprenyl-3-methyl-5-hydroxy-6-metoxy-1,4-benzoquinol methylase
MKTKTKYGGMLSPYLRDRRIAVSRPYLTGRVLDVGCAEGHLAQHVAAGDYVGVDLDDEILDEARRNWPDHTFLSLGALDAAERFDTMVALAVVEHVPDPEGWLRGWADHLVPGGRVVLTTPHARWEPLHGVAAKLALTSDEAHDEHETTFDEASITRLVTTVGLELTTYKRFLAGMNQLIVATR